jgi:hypothetical protein
MIISLNRLIYLQCEIFRVQEKQKGTTGDTLRPDSSGNRRINDMKGPMIIIE